jgi:xylulokinase
MPQLFEGTAISGHLDPAVAARLGLPGVPVAAGGGDNAAGAVGMGLTEPGDAFLSLGTSGVLFAVSDGFAPNTDRAVHAFCHAVPDRWHQMAVVLSAASCLDWVARLTGFADVSNAVTAAEQAVDAHVPVFLPYLSGERTPHNDPHAKGVFFGLGHGTGSPELVRGVLEGVAFALADGAEALRSAGTRLDALTVIGGGARSRFWGCIIASALDCELEYRANGDVGPALGAARLAQIAVTRDFRAGLAKPPVLETVKPDADMAKALAPRHRLFRRLYTDLRPAFAQAAL